METKLFSWLGREFLEISGEGRNGASVETATLEQQVREVMTTLDDTFGKAKTDWCKGVKLSLLLQRGSNIHAVKRILAQADRLSLPEIVFTFVDGFAGEKYLIEIESTTLGG